MTANERLRAVDAITREVAERVCAVTADDHDRKLIVENVVNRLTGNYDRIETLTQDRAVR